MATVVTRAPGARKRSAWSVLGSILIVALAVVLILSSVAAAGGYLALRATLPQTTGTLNLKGLDGTVTVVRDSYGVPHVTATTLHDVAFTQGYVTAQDRLFQLEFNRAVAGGRLSELFGPGTDDSLVDSDRFLRTLGLYPAAQGEISALDAATRAELQAYADGINTFVTGHLGALPLEFTVLGVKWEPWTPVDSLAYGRVVAYTLDGTWNTKIARAMVLAKGGQSLLNTLFPEYPSQNPTLIQSAHIGTRSRGASQQTVTATSALSAADERAFAQISPRLLRVVSALQELLGNIHDGLGSNDWVVDGSLTASGKPLLANDPHLGIREPAIWYQIALRGGGMDAIGFSFPGDPGIVIGHNARIAWGVTNVDADNSDLYLETLDPVAHPGQYLLDGRWRTFATRQETIHIRGQARTVSLTVQSTGHGPLLNSVFGDLKSQPAMSLHWTALQPGYTFRGFFQLGLASNWDQFNAAVDGISISQNFVYADVDGNIGYRMSGLLPLRPAQNHLLPVDGSSSANDWTGYVSQPEMPRVYNPPSHLLVTANNRIVEDASGIYVTADWDYGYRARRITDLLHAASRITPDTYHDIQTDVLSLPAGQIAPVLVAAGQSGAGDAASAARILSGWNFHMDRESAAAAVYEVTMGNLMRDTVESQLGAEVYAVYRGNFTASGVQTVLINELTSPDVDLFPGAGGPEQARDQAIQKALAETMSQLRKVLGPNASTWRWGTLHTAHFAHPLASVSPLNLLFDIKPLERPGDSVTVNAAGGGGFSADPPIYGQATTPSMREIIDLANLDNSRWVITVGESGQPLSSHYADAVPLWDSGRYEPMRFSAAAVGQDSVEVLTLKPGK